MMAHDETTEGQGHPMGTTGDERAEAAEVATQDVATAGDATEGAGAWDMLVACRSRGASDWLVAVSNLFLQFMAYSAVGWVYETINDMIFRHGFFPRASLAGPWCPIYGIGGLLIVCCLHSLPRHRGSAMGKVGEVVAVAAGICVLVTAVELLGSYVCEWLMGEVPWDYSSYWGNFDGRIAPTFTIRFVLGGLVFLYLMDPAMSAWCRRHERAAVVLSAVLLVLFVADNALETAGVWSVVVPRSGIPF